MKISRFIFLLGLSCCCLSAADMAVTKSERGDRRVMLEKLEHRQSYWELGRQGYAFYLTKVSVLNYSATIEENIRLEPDNIEATTAALKKVLSWAETTRKNNPPPFEKELEVKGSSSWNFEWESGARVTIFTGSALISDKDAQALLLLIEQIDAFAKEQRDQQSQADSFKSSLK